MSHHQQFCGVLHECCFIISHSCRGRHLHTRTAITLTECDLTFITKEDVARIAEDYPELMERIEALAAKRLGTLTVFVDCVQQ